MTINSSALIRRAMFSAIRQFATSSRYSFGTSVDAAYTFALRSASSNASRSVHPASGVDATATTGFGASVFVSATAACMLSLSFQKKAPRSRALHLVKLVHIREFDLESV